MNDKSQALQRFQGNIPLYINHGFRKTTSTSVRKDYGTDQEGQKRYIRLTPFISTVNGLGPWPTEMSNDVKDLRFWGVL